MRGVDLKKIKRSRRSDIKNNREATKRKERTNRKEKEKGEWIVHRGSYTLQTHPYSLSHQYLDRIYILTHDGWVELRGQREEAMKETKKMNQMRTMVRKAQEYINNDIRLAYSLRGGASIHWSCKWWKGIIWRGTLFLCQFKHSSTAHFLSSRCRCTASCV